MIRNTKKNLKNKKGFTLIELVVVIAVIGILAAIAIPRVTGITTKAKTQATKQHIAELNSALERYMAETSDDDASELRGAATAEAAAASNSITKLKELNYLSDTVSATMPNGNAVKLNLPAADAADKDKVYYFKE